MEIVSSETVAVDSIEWADWTDAIGVGTADDLIGERLHVMGVPRNEYGAARQVIDQRLEQVDPIGVIARGIAFYDEFSRPPGTRLRIARKEWERRRDDVVRRTIHDLLAGRRWEIENEEVQSHELRLVTLSGPRTDPSFAEWKSSADTGVTTGWKLRITGVGAGRDTSMAMSHGVTMRCDGDEGKMLCVGVELGIRKVACIDRKGKRVGSQLTAEVFHRDAVRFATLRSSPSAA